MKLSVIYIKIRDKWWGLPLFLPFLTLSIFAHINTFAYISSGEVFPLYLPLALMISMTILFSWVALPGTALGIFIRKYAELGFYETLSLTANFIIITILCWGGYKVFTLRRNNVSHGDSRLISQRLFWQTVSPITLFLIFSQFAAFVGLLASRENLVSVMPFNPGTLTNYQVLLVGNLIGVPLCYFVIRVARSPLYLCSYYSQLKQQVDAKAIKKEFAIWLLALSALLLLLCMPLNEKSTIFSTSYTLSLLLPLMMWGAMRYGYKLVSLFRAVVLMISIHSYQNYIPIHLGYIIQLTIASSSHLAFSFTVNYMAVPATRQRAVVRCIQRLTYVDPVVHLSNVRALSRALHDVPWSVFCYLRISGMETLVKNYGTILRIQYKQKPSHRPSPLLESSEGVYQLSSNDLVLRLNTESHRERIIVLDSHLKRFRFFWDGILMQPQIGVSYCYVHSPVNHIYPLLGELNTVAELSIVTNAPESMQHREATCLQRGLKDKVVMMNRLQRALEHNHFFLMAQPITGMRGDVYREILLCTKGENDELISSDSFLLVACELGLSSSTDMWVIEHTLQFTAEDRVKMPVHRFAINLSPTSICQVCFPVEVSQPLAKCQIGARQLIFEITESNVLTNVKWAQITLQHLQESGCQVTIDDSGTGYASYAWLKNVNVDLLKIDGSLIRNIVSNSLDYQIVAPVCHPAQMKKMWVVAEYVENEETREAALSLGIDYIQGYLIGKPQSLVGTLNEIEPIREST